jgi:arylsulfatase A
MNKRVLPAMLIILALAVDASQTRAADVERPHIVIILVDDMGYGDPGCFNANSKIATSQIDALARDGMRFTDARRGRYVACRGTG